MLGVTSKKVLRLGMDQNSKLAYESKNFCECSTLPDQWQSLQFRPPVPLNISATTTLTSVLTVLSIFTLYLLPDCVGCFNPPPPPPLTLLFVILKAVLFSSAIPILLTVFSRNIPNEEVFHFYWVHLCIEFYIKLPDPELCTRIRIPG
jgi:hypothetical protein